MSFYPVWNPVVYFWKLTLCTCNPAGRQLLKSSSESSPSRLAVAHWLPIAFWPCFHRNHQNVFTLSSLIWIMEYVQLKNCYYFVSRFALCASQPFHDSLSFCFLLFLNGNICIKCLTLIKKCSMWPAPGNVTVWSFKRAS